MKYWALFFSLVCLWYYRFAPAIALVPKHRSISIVVQEDIKGRAFLVLRDKCNICHATKKKTNIFTLENMDSLAVDIYKQVFVKKKMPKGRKIKLTEDERGQLKIWLDETLIEK